MIKPAKIFCDNCEKELDFVLIDGYLFGDRLLEGVMFKISLSENGRTCIGVDSESEVYMKQLNWKYWKKQCEDFCTEYDLAECPYCGEEVLIEQE